MKKFLQTFKACCRRAFEVSVMKMSVAEAMRTDSGSIRDVYKSYLLALAAVTPICMFLRGAFLPEIAPATVVYGSAGTYVVLLALPLVAGLISEFLAQQLGGGISRTAAFKLAVYSFTPTYLSGVFLLMGFLGALSALLILACLGYTIYLFHGATPAVTGVPKERQGSFVIGVVGTLIVAISLLQYFTLGSR